MSAKDAHLEMLDQHEHYYATHGHTNPHHLTGKEVWQRIDFMKVSEKTPEEVWKQIDFLEVGPKLAKIDAHDIFRRIDFLDVEHKL